MTVRDRLERVARLAAARPLPVLVVVAVLALGGGALALGLQPSTDVGTFVSSSSPQYRATQLWHRHFGQDSIVILVREPLTDLVLTKDLASLTFLEACLAGEQAVADPVLHAFRPVSGAQAVPYGGRRSACGQLMAGRYVQAVYGPGTFLNQAVIAVSEGLAALEGADARAVTAAERQAAAVARAEHKSPAVQREVAKAAGELQAAEDGTSLAQLALTSGIASIPTIDNQQFISQVVFDDSRGANQPKARFAYLFPTARSALIQVRLRSSLSPAQQQRAIALIRRAVKMPQFRLGYRGTYLVTGAPVVLNDLAARVTSSAGVLLLAALLVMAVVLLIVFSPRRPARPPASPERAGGESSGWPLRLLPLAIALAATGITFGAVSLAGGTLTMASIAVLPVLIGLAVDYAIQFQSRIEEARWGGGGGRRGRGPRRPGRATGLPPGRLPPRRPRAGPPPLGRPRSPWRRWRRPPASSSSCSPRCRWWPASASCSWSGSRWPSRAR